jgi:hypothetical protein
MFRIVSQTSDLPLEQPRLGHLVDYANQSLDRLNRPAAIIGASDQVEPLAAGATDVANTLASALGPLLARFKGFMEVADQLGDHLAKVCDYIDILLRHQPLACTFIQVHPYFNAAWIVLSFVHKVVSCAITGISTIVHYHHLFRPPFLRLLEMQQSTTWLKP